MDKLIEKHRLVQIQNDSIWDMVHNNANITKEVACGFAEWLLINTDKELIPNESYKYEPKYFYTPIGAMIAEEIPVSELFDLYIKSL